MSIQGPEPGRSGAADGTARRLLLAGLTVGVIGSVIGGVVLPMLHDTDDGVGTILLRPRTVAASARLPATSDCPSLDASVRPVTTPYAGEPFAVTLIAHSGSGPCTLRTNLAIALPGDATVTPADEVEVEVGSTTRVTWTVLPTAPGPGSVVVLIDNSRGQQLGSFPIEVTTSPDRRAAAAVEWMSTLVAGAKAETRIDGGRTKINRSTVVTTTVDLAPGPLPSGLSAVADLEVCLDLAGVTAAPVRNCQTTTVSLDRPSHIERLFPVDAPADRGEISAVAELRLTGQVDGKPIRGTSHQFASDPGRAALGVGDVASGGWSLLQALLTALGGVAGVSIVVGAIVAWHRRRVETSPAPSVSGPTRAPAAETLPTAGSDATTGTPTQG